MGALSSDLSSHVHVSGRAVFSAGCSRPVYDQTGHSSDYLHFEDLPSVLYKDQFSVFPVLTERRSDEYSLMSFVNARKYKKIDEEAQILTWIRNNRGLLGERMVSSFLVVCLFDDSFVPLALHTNGKQEVLPASFIFLVFPFDIWNKYCNRAKINIPTKVVPEVRRRIAGISGDFAVLDYERAIEEILEEKQVPVWVHAVRLPTKEDVLAVVN